MTGFWSVDGSTIYFILLALFVFFISGWGKIKDFRWRQRRKAFFSKKGEVPNV